MASRGQSVVLTYVAWDASANAGKTGDVANHTLRWIKDGTSAAPTNAAAEVDGTNAPGVYKLTLTTTECTCDCGTLGGKSSTANVAIIPLTVTFEQLPTATAGANGGLPVLSGTTLPYTISTLTTYTGNTPQTGDNFARIGAAGAGLTALGDARIANLDAAITTRMATYTQPTGFLAATFPTGTVASTTNITAGTITTVTNLTNLPAAPTDWLSAAAVSAAAVTKVQAGLSTYAGADTAGTTTLLARLTDPRATNLDNLDAAVSSRLATAGYTAPDNTTLGYLAGLLNVGHTAFTATALAAAPTGGGGGLDAAGVRAAVGLAAANLDTQLADRTGYLLAPAGLDAVVVEAGVNARQALAPILAACAGVISGQETGTVTIKGGNVTTTRIVAVTDASGNRTAVTLTLPS